MAKVCKPDGEGTFAADNRTEFVGGPAGPNRKGGGLISALLLGYCDPQRRLICAGHAGSDATYTPQQSRPMAQGQMVSTPPRWGGYREGCSRLRPSVPLDMPPPRGSRFGSRLVPSCVHWLRPELVAAVKFLNWTEDNLLRHVVYKGLREDKPASGVRREAPHRKSRETKPPPGANITPTPDFTVRGMIDLHHADLPAHPRQGRLRAASRVPKAVEMLTSRQRLYVRFPR
jgi:bifunctional non-homologous end joining protein LigD